MSDVEKLPLKAIRQIFENCLMPEVSRAQLRKLEEVAALGGQKKALENGFSKLRVFRGHR